MIHIDGVFHDVLQRLEFQEKSWKCLFLLGKEFRILNSLLQSIKKDILNLLYWILLTGRFKSFNKNSGENSRRFLAKMARTRSDLILSC